MVALESVDEAGFDVLGAVRFSGSDTDMDCMTVVAVFVLVVLQCAFGMLSIVCDSVF